MGDKTVHTTSTKVHLFWDSFLKADSNCPERSAWYDLFLAEALLQLHDGKSPSEIFSLTSNNVSNVIANETLLEIKNICSNQVDEDDLDPLKKYLLNGRGWRSLAVLHALDVYDVTCAGELSSVLISVYGIENGTTDDVNPYVVAKPAADIELVCKFRQLPKFKGRTLSMSSGLEGSPCPSRKVSVSSYTKRMQKQERAKNSSESDNGSSFKSHSHKASSLKIFVEPIDFDGFSLGALSDDERKTKSVPPYLKRKSKKVPSEFTDERIVKVFKQTVSSCQFRVLLVGILQGLSQLETPGSNLHVNCFNFSLDQLCSLHFNAISTNSVQIEDLKQGMTRLLLIALEKVLLRSDDVNSVVSKGALPIMLRLLEDGITKTHCNKKRTQFLHDFIYGLIYAVINLVQALLFQQSTFDHPETFLSYFQQFINSCNGRIIDKTVTALAKFKTGDDKTALVRTRKLIGLLSQMVVSFKQIRTKLAHKRSCRRSKHKTCRYTLVCHHHDNAFGRVYTNALLTTSGSNEGTCAISSLFMIFTRLLSDHGERDITIRTLQGMMQCGTCCCFPAPTLISRILKVIQGSDARVRNLGLVLLEKTIYREVGAIDLMTMCQVCVNVEEKDKSFLELSKHRWACLEAFQDMLLSPNEQVSYAVALHLMRVTPRCSIQVQREMFFGVFYPVFLTSKKRYAKSKTEKDKLTLIMCLSAFTNLIGRMRFADEFLQRGGLNDIMELIQDRNFVHLCCLITEIIVIVRIWKLENQQITNILDENIEELKILVKFVLDYSNEFLTLLKKLESDTKLRNQQKNIFSADAEFDNYTKCLEKLSIFWKSWTNLCLYCPQIRSYCTRHLSMQSYTLLSLFLQHLSKNIIIKDNGKGDVNEKIATVNQLHNKLLESLLVLSVISPYSGNPGGISGLEKKLVKVIEGNLGLRAVCDILIRGSGANPCKKTMIPTHPMPRMDMLEFGLINLTEEHQSDSSLENSADEGYDADIDLPCRKVRGKDVSGKESLPPSRKISTMFGERRTTMIAHPSLCILSLKLITACHKNEKWTKDCIYSLHRLSSTLRDFPDNSVRIASSGFTRNLLTDFSDLLSYDTPSLYELQMAVLDVFSLIAKFHIRPEELTTFIRFFISKKPPLKKLLPALLKVLSGTINQPKYILCFPSPYSNANLINTTPAHKLGISLHQHHISTGIDSCWSRSALFLPLNAELGWAMWVHGFSFSMWLRLEPLVPVDTPLHDEMYAESSSSESGRSSGLDELSVDNLLHVLSVGYEAHILEFWVETTRELLHVRLTRSDGDNVDVLCEVSLEGRLTSNSWHHLAISVHDSVHNGKTVIEVTLIIDGWCEVQIPLAFKGILVRKSRPTNVLLGDTKTAGDLGKWQLGGLIMLRKPLIDKKAAIWLTALGPDCYSLTKTRIGNIEPAWHSVFNVKTLTSGVPWADILDNSKANIKELQENVLLSYSAKMPGAMNVFPIASATSAGLGGGFRVIGVEQRCSQLVPMYVQLVTYCEATVQTYYPFTSAVRGLGGIPVFLFLFARVVELGGGELEQAQALELLLRLAHQEPDLKEQSTSFIPLIRHVIETNLCLPGPLMLKAIFDVCCDKPGLIICWGEEVQVTHEGSDFLLTEPFLVTKLVLGPAQRWLSCLSLFLKALLVLLKDDHPYREFNSAQLNRANALDALLNLCKERLVEDHTKLEPTVCGGIVNVIRGLMTAPPQLQHVTAIADFLLLAHPAHATYISHARSSMYFSIPPKPPPKNKKQNRKKLGIFERDETYEYKGLFTHPVDAGKLSKALANLQIKHLNKPRWSVDSTAQREDPCDSGIAGSSYRDNATDSDNLTQECDRLSSNSANTYFLNCTNVETEGNSIRDDSSNASEEDEKFMSDHLGDDESEDIVTIGLLDLLRDQILVTPDAVAHNALPNALSPESFIVMANNSNTAVTTAVVKVLSAYLERANGDERNRFIRDKGFYLLAMQLSHVSPSSELADALAGMITNTYWLPISTQLNCETIDFNLPGIPPLLSLLPKSISDIALAHNMITFLQNVFKAGDWRKLLEFGLVEALLKTLMGLVHAKKTVLNDLCIPEHNIIICDINTFLSFIAVHAIQTPGSNNTQVLSDIIMQIEYVCSLERKTCGEDADCIMVLKHTHCCVIQVAIKALSDTIAAFPTKSPFLSSVISLSSDEVDALSSSSCSSLNTIGKLSKSELNERFKSIVTKATEFVIYSEPIITQISNSEDELKIIEFIMEVWMFILQALVTVIERKSMSVRTSWSNVVWANREVIRNLGSQIFLWVLSPPHSKQLKMFVVQSILNEPRSKDILMYILCNTNLEKKLALFLWDIRNNVTHSESDVRACEELSSKVEEWCNSAVLGLVNGSCEISVENVIEACIEAKMARSAWQNQRNSLIQKVVYRHESLVKRVSERAMDVTREVVANQSHQRKLLMESIKTGFGSKVQAVFNWKEIVSNFTHERAVWHFPDVYPKSWELDPTEGPFRVRNRLRRSALDIEPKFFRKDRISSAGPPKRSPLHFIFEGSLSTSAVLIDRLHTNTKIRHMIKASVITPDRAVPGELLIGHCSLYFVPSTDDNTMEWTFDQIKELHRRRFELQERALEIFLTNGNTFLVAFESLKDRDWFMSELLDCELCNRVASEPLGDAVDLWREGHLTNWQYLSILNTLAGRSYNDLMQYPILPFVLSDYTSKELDLNDVKSFRNLQKPMAIQDKKNEAHYIQNYNYLKGELADALNVMSHNHEPYHYSSHYSNSGIVLHFLVRLPPFTSMFLSYQDNNFDWPDRTFHSLHTTWRLTSSDSATDVKELIPEFFFLPEFLQNLEGFDFGTRQNGEVVDDVVLPPWAPDARLFVLIHRQALESDYVREYLPHWIDLVFGYKQTGKAAVDCINVFHPATYYGFDPESISDPLLRTAWKTMVRMYGQTPRQLFRAPHPMVVKSLAPTPIPPQVLSSVKGLQWGHYVGSPGDSAPILISQHTHHIPITSLVSLMSNDVFGLASKSTLLLSYNKESSLSFSVSGSTCVLGAALLSWGHGDGVVRAKLRKEQVPFPAISSHGDTIALCSSVPDCNQLWIAFTSGKIHVYSYKFDGVGGSLEFGNDWSCLVGHTSTITGIAISRAFSIAVSVSEDGSAIIWDINTLKYIRSLPIIALPITLVGISETLGDVVTVGQDSSGGSNLRLHSVNATLVGSVTTREQITAVCFSTAPEGISVNVVAGGMSDGVIRLWNTWDLTLVGIITTQNLKDPIISLAYSQDSQHLYASTAEGFVVVWQGSSATSSKAPRFLNLTSLL